METSMATASRQGSKLNSSSMDGSKNVDTARDDSDLDRSDTASVGSCEKRMSVIDLWRSRESKCLQKQSTPSYTGPKYAKRLEIGRAAHKASVAAHATISEKISISQSTTSMSCPSDEACESEGREGARDPNKKASQHMDPSSSPDLSARRSHELVPRETGIHLVEENTVVEPEKQTVLIQSPRTAKKQEARSRRTNLLNVWALQEKAAVSPSQVTRRSPASVTSAFFDPEPGEMHGTTKASEFLESPKSSLCRHKGQSPPVSPHRRSLSVLDRWKRGMVHTDDFSSSQESSPIKVNKASNEEVTKATTARVVSKAKDLPRGKRAPSQDSSSRPNAQVSQRLNPKVTSDIAGTQVMEESSVVERRLSIGQKTRPNQPKAHGQLCHKAEVDKAVGMRPHSIGKAREHNANCEREQYKSISSEVVVRAVTASPPQRKEASSPMGPLELSKGGDAKKIDLSSSSVRRNLVSSFSSAQSSNSMISSGKPRNLDKASDGLSGARALQRAATSTEGSISTDSSFILFPATKVARSEAESYNPNHIAKTGSQRSNKDTSAEEKPESPPNKRRTNVAAARSKYRSQGRVARYSTAGKAKIIPANHAISVGQNVSDGRPVSPFKSEKGSLGQQQVRKLDEAMPTGYPSASPVEKVPKSSEYQSQSFASSSFPPAAENVLATKRAFSKHRSRYSMPEDSETFQLDYSLETVLSSRSDLSPPTVPSMPTLLSSESFKANTVYYQSKDVPHKAAQYELEAIKLSMSSQLDDENNDSEGRTISSMQSSGLELEKDSQWQHFEKHAREVDFERFRSGNQTLSMPSSNGPQMSAESHFSASEIFRKGDQQPKAKAHCSCREDFSPVQSDLTTTTSVQSNSTFSNSKASLGETKPKKDSFMEGETDPIADSKMQSHSKEDLSHLEGASKLGSWESQSKRATQNQSLHSTCKEESTQEVNMARSEASAARRNQGIRSSSPNDLRQSGDSSGSISTTNLRRGAVAVSTWHPPNKNSGTKMHRSNSKGKESLQGHKLANQHASVSEEVGEQGTAVVIQRGKFRQAQYMKKSKLNKLRANRRRVEGNCGSGSVTPTKSAPAQLDKKAVDSPGYRGSGCVALTSAPAPPLKKARAGHTGYAGSSSVVSTSAPPVKKARAGHTGYDGSSSVVSTSAPLKTQKGSNTRSRRFNSAHSLMPAAARLISYSSADRKYGGSDHPHPGPLENEANANSNKSNGSHLGTPLSSPAQAEIGAKSDTSGKSGSGWSTPTSVSSQKENKPKFGNIGPHGSHSETPISLQPEDEVNVRSHGHNRLRTRTTPAQPDNEENKNRGGLTSSTSVVSSSASTHRGGGETNADETVCSGPCSATQMPAPVQPDAINDGLNGSHSVLPVSASAAKTSPQPDDKSNEHSSRQVRSNSAGHIDNSRYFDSRSVTPMSAPAQSVKEVKGEDSEDAGPSECLDTPDFHQKNNQSDFKSQQQLRKKMKKAASNIESIQTKLRQTSNSAPPFTNQLQNEHSTSEAGHSDSLSFFSHAGSAFSGYSGRSSFLTPHQGAALAAQGTDSRAHFHSQLVAGRRLEHRANPNSVHFPSVSGANQDTQRPRGTLDCRWRTGLASRYNTSSRFLDGVVDVSVDASGSAGADNSSASSAERSSSQNSDCASETSRSYESGFVSESEVYTTIDESYNSFRASRGRAKAPSRERVCQDGLSQTLQDAYHKLSNNVSGSVMAIDLRQLSSGLNDGVLKASQSIREMVGRNNAKQREENAFSSGKAKDAEVDRSYYETCSVDEAIAIEVEYVSEDSEDDSEELFLTPSEEHVLHQEFVLSMSQDIAQTGFSAFVSTSDVSSIQEQSQSTMYNDSTTCDTSGRSLHFLGQIQVQTATSSVIAVNDDT